MELIAQNPPVALGKPEPAGPEMIELGEYLLSYRDKYGLTQMQAAKLLGVEYRRLQVYEAAGRWSAKNKASIRACPGIFDFTETLKLARQGWPNQRSLGAAIQRIIEGLGARKRNARLPVVINPSPEIERALERLRTRYGTKVVITDQSINLQYFGKPEILEMLLSKLLREDELRH